MRLRVTALLGCICLIGVLNVGCIADVAERVRIENRSDETVNVYTRGRFVSPVEPDDVEEFTVIRFREGTRTWDVRALDGTVLVSRTFTWDEIADEEGITLLIDDD
jgi:hypothetical protein